MKTTSKAIEESQVSASLIRSVIRAIGDKSSLEDVYNHGADGGFCGFVYYSDTGPFYKRNREAINSLVMQYADDFGEDPVKMVAGWRCMNGEEEKDIGRVIYGGRVTENDYGIANGLAWFALEEVARAFCDE